MRVILPKHVQACQHSPLPALMRWFIYTWRKANPAVQTRVPYSCNSWRCPTCSRHEAAVLFARMQEAWQPLDPQGWCFLVLTLDRNGAQGGKVWADTNNAYRQLNKLTRAALDRIGRNYGPDTRAERSGRSGELRTVRKLGNRWIAVVEAHRSGWPHVNLFVWCPELAEALRAEKADRMLDPEVRDAVERAQQLWRDKLPVPASVRDVARRATVAGGSVLELLRAAGWGYQSTAEAARDVASVMAYGVKLAGLHDASLGELAKVTQAPLNAPGRFRRYRSGKGFLPPRRSNPEVTGCMVRRRRSREGDWEIHAVNAPKDPLQADAVERARNAELQLIDEEERALSRGNVPALTPVRSIVNGQLRDTGARLGALQQRADAIDDLISRRPFGPQPHAAPFARRTAELHPMTPAAVSRRAIRKWEYELAAMRSMWRNGCAR